MKCLLCGQTMKTVLTFSSLLLLRNDDSCLCSDCDSTLLSIKCQDCQLWCKEGVEVSHRAIFTYNQAMKDFFSRYKFDGDFLLRKVFASFLSEELKKYKEYQFVVIPLSPDRYANRGFNQVEGLVEAAGFEYLDLLEKREERASSSKNRSERLGTELPFFIKSGVTIPKKILLIDDIYTTGATINRVKKLLEEAGAKDVKTFSLVR
ncbi:TPA: ComF family protein [Streptococcus pneumoniae]|nr:ComF family protein [Streptococcus pneumoniae]